MGTERESEKNPESAGREGHGGSRGAGTVVGMGQFKDRDVPTATRGGEGSAVGIMAGMGEPLRPRQGERKQITAVLGSYGSDSCPSSVMGEPRLPPALASHENLAVFAAKHTYGNKAFT